MDKFFTGRRHSSVPVRYGDTLEPHRLLILLFNIEASATADLKFCLLNIQASATRSF
jgi:hypothetical protein